MGSAYNKNEVRRGDVMNWKDSYKSKLMSAEEAAKIVKSGDRFWTPLCLSQPSTLIMDAIADRKDELEDIEYVFAFILRPYKLLQPEYRDTFDLVSTFYSPMPHQQQLAKSEWANYWACQSSDVAIKVPHRERVIPKRMGTILQVSPPNEHGYVNLGLDSFFTAALMQNSEYVIAEINEYMPRTFGETDFHVSKFTAFVENSTPLPTLPSPTASELEVKMAENVVGLIRDRDCLQVGIGSVPAMISKLLQESGLKDIGIHTELAPTGIKELVEKGVVTGKYKKVSPGKIVLTFAMGDQELYDWLGNNPLLEWRPTLYANNIAVIAQEHNMVAINGTLAVDLTGQISSESMGNFMRSGPGGQLDFVVGAFWSPGGRAINLVPSTAKNGEISRIVPYLDPGTRVTVPRTYAGYIVTEYGVADLYGLSEPERAAALIKVAHPKFTDELEKASRERGLLQKKIFATS